MPEIREYKRSVEDEIDWKIIDQLHAATVSFSSTSLELKKLLFVLIGIAVPSLVKLAGDKLDYSLFSTIYIFVLTFWFFDSFTYFYQEKLREKMDHLFNQIRERNKNVLVVSADGNPKEFTLEKTRTNKTRIWRSITNPSMRFYIILLLVNSIGFILFVKDIIK